MKTLLPLLLGGAAFIASLVPATAEVFLSPIKACYTRLPYDDHGMTGKYADNIVELPSGQFIFSREFGYQPRWKPTDGKEQSVARLSMDPVFMALSQSAAIAAGLAINQNSAVQELNYPTLAKESKLRGGF